MNVTDNELVSVRGIIRFELAQTNSFEYLKISRVTYKIAELFGSDRCRDLHDLTFEEIEKAQRERQHIYRI
jgi:hypothetical protein